MPDALATSAPCQQGSFHKQAFVIGVVKSLNPDGAGWQQGGQVVCRDVQLVRCHVYMRVQFQQQFAQGVHLVAAHGAASIAGG